MAEGLQERAAEVFEKLHSIATEHAERSNGQLVALEYDQENLNRRDILKYTINGAPLSPDVSDTIAISFDPRYKSLYEENEQSLEIGSIGQTLSAQTNVTIGTNHAEVVDIALELLAASNVLRRAGIGFKSGLIASRMIEFLGAPTENGVVPVVDLLSLAVDRIWLTLPNTVSTRNKIDHALIHVYNSLVLRSLNGDLNRRPRSNKLPFLTGVALSGTVDKSLDVAGYNTQQTHSAEIPKELQYTTIVVGQFSYGVAEFLQHCLSYVGVLNLANSTNKLAIDPQPIHIKDPQDVENAATKIVRLLNSQGKQLYVYDSNGDLPVIRAK